MRAVGPQHSFLGGRREQTVPGHTNTLASTTDIPGEAKVAWKPRLKMRAITSRTQ
jgi:hypothetical protein